MLCGITAIGRHDQALLTSVALTIMEGIKYRAREEQGLDPIWAPEWAVVVTQVGMSLFLIAVVALGLIGISVLLKRKRSGVPKVGS
jgi:hypothetical protein